MVEQNSGAELSKKDKAKQFQQEHQNTSKTKTGERARKVELSNDNLSRKKRRQSNIKTRPSRGLRSRW